MGWPPVREEGREGVSTVADGGGVIFLKILFIFQI